jgi:hypothetical protein
VELDHSMRDGCIVVALTGPINLFTAPRIQPEVAKVLERVAVPNFLPLYTTVEEALDKAAARPPYLRDELSLAPTATAPAAARL